MSTPKTAISPVTGVEVDVWRRLIRLTPCVTASGLYLDNYIWADVQGLNRKPEPVRAVSGVREERTRTVCNVG